MKIFHMRPSGTMPALGEFRALTPRQAADQYVARVGYRPHDPYELTVIAATDSHETTFVVENGVVGTQKQP